MRQRASTSVGRLVHGWPAEHVPLIAFARSSGILCTIRRRVSTPTSCAAAIASCVFIAATT